MNPPRILTLDNALGTTGVCHNGAAQAHTLPPVRDRTEANLARRLIAYEEWLLGILRAARPQVAVIEGYSYASANRAHGMGELGWACRRTLWQCDVPWAVVTPGQLTKYATGKGNSSKEAVLAEAIRRLGYGGHDNNAADALWLWAMAADHYTEGKATTSVLGRGDDGTAIPTRLEHRVPQAHRAVLAKITWPEPSDWRH